MNRLILIGNGFDLAHGLPTSYSSFLNFLWQNFNQARTNPLFQGLFEINYGHFSDTSFFENYKDFCNKIRSDYNTGRYSIAESYYGDTSFKVYFNSSIYHSPESIFSFKNKLFELITVENATNWVDIENIYYKVLISIVKDDGKYRHLGSITRLNLEFNEIKYLLEYYLTKNIDNSFEFSNSYDDCSQIIDLFEYKFKNLSIKPKDTFFLEFPPDYSKKIEKFDYLLSPSYIDKSNSAYENLFLDFNYTSNIANYVSILNSKNSRAFGESTHIQIHGKLNDDINPVNFGFGDEMDEHYKILENTDNNAFLENIKSFMYLNNSNYKKLLNWIESEDYQIYIMGHSCGLSDRTLLNTLFEHNNCKSIKIFYYKRNDNSDNFKELSQNISRHFNKKALMRQKVVDKTLSLPLPQNVRYAKKTI